MAIGFFANVDGKFGNLLKGQWEDLKKPVRAEVMATAVSLRDDLRGQVRDAGLGTGLANAWQLLEPGGKFRFSALVYSKAVRLHEAFNSAETVHARNAQWLALPTADAVRLGLSQDWSKNSGRGGDPRRWSNVAAAIRRFGDLSFVKLSGGRAMLVAPKQLAAGGGAGRGLPLFLLVRQERRAKRLDIEAAVARARARFRGNMSKLLGTS